MSAVDFIRRGESAAVPMRYLRKMTGLDSRTVRLEIEAARRRGVPICSNNLTGYYLAGSEWERARFVRSMRGRAAQILATADAVEQAALD